MRHGHRARALSAQLLAPLALLATARVALADDPSQPHHHQGVFKRYVPGPPSKVGLVLSTANHPPTHPHCFSPPLPLLPLYSPS